MFDLAAGTVLRVDDHGVVPGATRPRTDQAVGARREDLKALAITPSRTDPASPSMATNVRWQNWHVQVGYSVREGLVLHDIGYEEKGRVRPIMRRASMAEMVVPYGDPSPWKFSP